MADDTRKDESSPPKEDLSREALTVNPQQRAFAGKQWQDPQTQKHRPQEQVNMIPGGTMNTAGGKIPEVTLGNALSSIRPEEFTEIHKKPCVRTALLTGMGVGFGLGGVRAMLGGEHA